MIHIAINNLHLLAQRGPIGCCYIVGPHMGAMATLLSRALPQSQNAHKKTCPVVVHEDKPFFPTFFCLFILKFRL